MRQIGTLTTTLALMLNLGVASAYAHDKPVTLSFSGTAVSSTINLQPGASTSEYTLNGGGPLGQFTFTGLEASSLPPGACPATDHPYAGGGVFRFEDGSLLMVSLTQGSDCLEFTPTGPVAYCTRTFKVTGGTGNFQNASGGAIVLTETVLAVLFDASTNPVFFASAGTITLSVSGDARATRQ